MERYLMAVDAGTGSVRAVIFDTQGQQIALEQREWTHKEDPRYPGSQDFDWVHNWDLSCACMQGALQKSGLDPRQIAAISTTCMREGIVLYDRQMQELWACANVDARAGDEVVQLMRDHPALELDLYRQSGQSFALDALPRLMWVKNKLPEIYERTCYVGMFNDWLICKLTGELKVEPSNGSTSGLFDLASRRFDTEPLRRCGLKENILPESIECGKVAGEVNADAAAQTGLAVGTPVVAGGGDAQLGTIGVGAVLPGQAATFGGSFWQYEFNTEKPLTDAQGRVRVNCHAIPGQWQFEALIFQPGLVMRWFRDAFCAPLKELASEQGLNIYDYMNAEAARVPPGCHGMLCAFSDVMNFTSWKHAAPTFGNFDLDAQKFNLYTFYRAIQENTALVNYGHMQLVKETTGQLPEYLIFAGGAAKSPLWSQILCDVMGLPLQVPVVKEATALGAALLAGCAVGIWPDLSSAVACTVKIERELSPDPQNHELYLKLYERWQDYYQAQLKLSDRGLTSYMWKAPGV
ncbi:MAG: autoinducer-2 kinase [Succinivibrio sp.]|nr:autoinducer-2 kinase [Succinivibrio sp.]